MSAFEFVVVAFAAYRAARFLALDSLTEPFRERLTYWSAGSGWREKFSDLITCGWCNGYWLSGLAYLVFMAVTGRLDNEPVLIHLIMWWAVAGVQALLISIDSFLLREAPPK
jgi:hypothetical protein